MTKKDIEKLIKDIFKNLKSESVENVDDKVDAFDSVNTMETEDKKITLDKKYGNNKDNKKEFLIDVKEGKKYTLNIDSNVIDVDIRCSEEDSFNIYVDNYEKIKKKEKLIFEVDNIGDKIDINLKYKGVNISNNSINITGRNSSIVINNGNFISISRSSNENSNSDKVNGLRLVVLVPRLEGILSNVYVNSISSDISIKDIESVGDIKINSTSGDINLKNNKCREVELNSMSGEIFVDSSLSDRLGLKTTSGDITCERVNSKVAVCNSLSGDVDMCQCEGEDININLTSGDILLSTIKYEKVNARTMSGDISLNNKAILEHKIKKLNIKTMSGKEKIFANCEF